MKEYRITKYNPEKRDDNGRFMEDEWTSYADVGKVYGENIFSISEYLETENKYLGAIEHLMSKNNIESFYIHGLEKNNAHFDEHTSVQMKKMFKELGKVHSVNNADIPTLCRLILREYIWCKLECSNMFVHFGYDYYMYVGMNVACDESIKKIKHLGLFVEPFESPYKS